MTDNQITPQDNPENPAENFISIEEAKASARRRMDLNDELFRRLANDERLEKTLESTLRDYGKTLKNLAHGDNKP